MKHFLNWNASMAAHPSETLDFRHGINFPNPISLEPHRSNQKHPSFFLFKFEAKEDMDRVLSGGPWFIRGHFVAIRLWEPNFKASMVEVNTVVVWVRLNELPVEYYDVAELREIGNAIRPVLKVNASIA
nr:hypothetical protein CFP56_45051 [Quercus suber]